MDWSAVLVSVISFVSGSGIGAAALNFHLKRREDVRIRLADQSLSAAKAAIDSLDRSVDMIYQSGWVSGHKGVLTISSDDPLWEEINALRFKMRRDVVLLVDEDLRNDVELVAGWLHEACHRSDIFDLRIAMELAGYVRDEVGQYLRGEPIYRETKIGHYRRELAERPNVIVHSN